MSFKSKWKASMLLAAGKDISAETEAVNGALEDLTAYVHKELKKHNNGEMSPSYASFPVKSLGRAWAEISSQKNHDLIKSSIESLEALCERHGVSMDAKLGSKDRYDYACIKIRLQMPSN
jgi:hypothetical protein